MSATGLYKATVTDVRIYKPPLPTDWVLIQVRLDVAAGGLWMRGREAVEAIMRASKAGALIQCGTRVVVTLHASRSSVANAVPDEVATLEVDCGEGFWRTGGWEML